MTSVELVSTPNQTKDQDIKLSSMWIGKGLCRTPKQLMSAARQVPLLRGMESLLRLKTTFTVGMLQHAHPAC